MRHYPPSLLSSLQSARGFGIAPAHFAWITAKDRTTGAPVSVGFWSGDEDVTVTVARPDGSGAESRTYSGGVGLRIEGVVYVADLTDNPVSVTLSQIAPSVQDLVRGLDVRLAGCEIHATTMHGGAFSADPQVEWVGIVDEGPISTPAAGSDGGVSLSIRSELMVMLTAINPAKSSDSHQRRRKAGDLFSKYASTITSRAVQWYKKG